MTWPTAQQLLACPRFLLSITNHHHLLPVLFDHITMTGPTSSNQRPVSSNNSRVFRGIFRVIARFVSDLPAFLAASATDYDNGPSARVPQENTSDHTSPNKRERDSDSESEDDASPHIPKSMSLQLALTLILTSSFQGAE